ncbi:MAG: hypothetical protein VKO64_03165 [Candidatus Sericytochromatia bacterium]|nr:hypothetical protein [Candidatus Sericytochromatia bacterium]
MRIQILQGNGHGTKLSWAGGKTIKVRAAGLLGAVAIDLPLTDPRINSPRGDTLDQIDIPGLLGLLNHPSERVTFLGEQAGLAHLKVTGSHLLSGMVSMTTGHRRALGSCGIRRNERPERAGGSHDLKQFRSVSDVSLDI